MGVNDERIDHAVGSSATSTPSPTTTTKGDNGDNGDTGDTTVTVGPANAGQEKKNTRPERTATVKDYTVRSPKMNNPLNHTSQTTASSFSTVLIMLRPARFLLRLEMGLPRLWCRHLCLHRRRHYAAVDERGVWSVCLCRLCCTRR